MVSTTDRGRSEAEAHDSSRNWLCVRAWPHSEAEVKWLHVQGLDAKISAQL